VTNLPSWLSTLQQNNQIKLLGFTFFEQPTQQKNNQLHIGEIRDIAIFTEPLPIFFDENRSDCFLVQLHPLPQYSPFLVPVKVDVTHIWQFKELFLDKMRSFPPIDANVEARLCALRIRTDAVHYAMAFPEAEVKRLDFVIGIGDEETMIDLENTAQQNDFLYGGAERLASMSGGKISQFWTIASKSLISIVLNFDFTEDGAVFLLQIEYTPHPYEALVQEIKTHLPHNSILPLLPNDIPADVIGALLGFNFPHLGTEMEYFGGVLNDNDFNALLFLAAMTENDRFEEVFSPLTNHSDEGIRAFIAEEATARFCKPVIKKILANEKSLRIRAAVKQLLKENGAVL
jgi:hypothetical protein